jgi:hemerythrin superfamily protein
MAKQAKKQRSKAAGTQATVATASENTNTTEAASDAISLLMNDHRTVEQLFERYRSTTSEQEKEQIAKQVCTELGIHAELEEEIFYPACREKVTGAALDEAQVEHDGAKVLIEDLLQAAAGEEFYDAKMTVLEQYIKHHVSEEEKPADGIFAQARASGLDVNELGQQIKARKTELSAQAESGRFVPPHIRSLTLPNDQEGSMPRNQQRDERGRFDEDDDRGYRSRNRQDDDEGGGRGRGQGGWFGDSEGHSRAAEMRWEGASRTRRGQDDDEDEGNVGRGRSSGRGHGGWFGDPEGHSRASERGWEERGGSRARGGRDDEDEDDDRGRSSGRGRGHGGWFGDPEGHSRASERG